MQPKGLLKCSQKLASWSSCPKTVESRKYFHTLFFMPILILSFHIHLHLPNGILHWTFWSIFCTLFDLINLTIFQFWNFHQNFAHIIQFKEMISVLSEVQHFGIKQSSHYQQVLKSFDLIWIQAVSMSAQLTCDPETAMSSSVMMPTQDTAWSWPYSVWIGRGVMWTAELFPVPSWLTSHTTQVVSLEPVTRNDPHWSRATHVTRSANIHINTNK
jgi:hypothetical protein